jgi:two-component system, OmpR family, response regulator
MIAGSESADVPAQDRDLKLMEMTGSLGTDRWKALRHAGAGETAAAPATRNVGDRDPKEPPTSLSSNGETSRPPGQPRILIIEDDCETCEEVSGYLSDRGYAVEAAETGAKGLAEARRTHFDVLIVDRMLPELDGLSLVAQLRRDRIRTPVLVLSALGSVDDRVTGLRAGGDDYLAKPFALVELAARIEALLRRPFDERETILRAGPLTLDLIERRAWRGAREIELLPREFKLLEYLMRRPDQVVTRAMLLEDVWNYRFLPETNVVDVHIGKLRRKIDGPGEASLLRGVRGAGFMLATASE